MLEVLREEKKYELSLPELHLIKHKLSTLMDGDIYNGDKPYLVRSLYFDSITDIDYFEKMVGVNERKKIRLRIYDTNDKKAKLELKAKSGCMQRKQSLTISKEDSMELIEGNYEVLNKYKEELAKYLYRKMSMELYRPKCIVEYDRTAFKSNCNNIRLTLDTQVRANEGNFDLYSKDLDFYPIMSNGRGILEVKYNQFLFSYIKEVISCVNKVETSVSKYCLSRSIGLGGD